MFDYKEIDKLMKLTEGKTKKDKKEKSNKKTTVKPKKELVASTKWKERVEVKYYFSVPCPKCKTSFDNYNVNTCEGSPINRMVTCFYCKTKFRLKVKGV